MRRYLKLATSEAKKSKCLRAKRGAVVVKNGKVLVKTYNQIFPTNDFCQIHGCLRDKLGLGLGQKLERCRSIHAEALAICQATQKRISLLGATIYLTGQPCINCAKFVFAAGIKKVYYLDVYGDRTGEAFLKKMGIICQRMKLKDDKPGERIRDIKGQQ